MDIEFFEKEAELLYVKENTEETIAALKRGEIENITFDSKLPVDKIVEYGLKKGFLKKGLRSFPDPRKDFEVPIEVMGIAHILQRLDDEHALLKAPFMINSAQIITELGYNIKVLNEGFNKRAKYPRQTPFHGETMKHVLTALKGEAILDWFNDKWRLIWKEEGVGATKCFIMDGMKVHVPEHLHNDYEGATAVKNEKGEMEYGYKAVWLYELHDKKGVVVAMKIAGIHVHDLELGKQLVSEFQFDKGSTLVMDRGFIDAKWIGELKNSRCVDVFIPLRKNMDATLSAVVWADNHNAWKPHPTRKDQVVAEIKSENIGWLDCPVDLTGALVRFKNKKGEYEEVLFVTTKKNQNAEKILQIYDLRFEIEEMHKQLKCYQSIEKLLSKKYSNVVFRIVTGVIAYNLLTVFLNSENCQTLEEFTAKSLRQKRRFEKNPNVIIYTATTFAIMTQFAFLPLILELDKPIQQKLADLFRKLDKK